MFTRDILLTLGLGALAFGCAEQPSETQETIDNLVQAGFPADDIMVIDGVVYVGGDAAVSLEASREMLQIDPSSTEEQYRTTNLVGTNITNVCVNGAALTNANLSNGLNRALAKYNNLGLRFRTTRTTGGTAGCSATITVRVTAGSGASAGFPSGGRPFGVINVGSALAPLPPETVGYILMHELGHTIGMRHADFFNRSISCGGAPTNEGGGGAGAILIPGTPSGAVVGGSIMNSCFRTSGESEQFRGSDVTALNVLY